MERKLYHRVGQGCLGNTNARDDHRNHIRLATFQPTISLKLVQCSLPFSRHPVVSRKTIENQKNDTGAIYQEDNADSHTVRFYKPCLQEYDVPPWLARIDMPPLSPRARCTLSF
ncbi:hypothetical protein TNCV_55791 [Trichonephila clavipes]|nr:hypothetical protein TNCV_55791 [Trichonephila clavipes]